MWTLVTTALALLSPRVPMVTNRRATTPVAVDAPRDEQWPSDLTSHVVRGIRLAVAEARATGGLRASVTASARIAKLVVNELFLFPATMVPFAVRTARYRRANVEYVESPQLEVYSAADAKARQEGPLVLYVHGGSWGQGAPWQYALLARRLLDEGGAGRVAVARYRLFPEGDVDDMLDDVRPALEWCRTQQAEAAARAPEEPPLRVVLAAQSAGAHLCALHLTRGCMGGADAWRPDKFVALSGVFDIAAHFAHERTRLVHWLSPMWLAMLGRGVHAGGEHAFAPLRGATDPQVRAADTSRASLEDAAAASAAPGGASDWRENELMAWAAASPTRLLRLRSVLAADAVAAPVAAAGGPPTRDAIERAPGAWPPTVVLHAADDKTVPVQSARDFVAALEATGASPHVDYREFARAGHGEIMLALMAPTGADALPAIASQFVQEVGKRA